MRRLAFLAMLSAFLALPVYAQSPNSKVVTGDRYRLNIEFNGGTPDTTVRFPNVGTGSNALISQAAGVQANRQSVQWIHCTLLSGTNDQLVGIWSPTFPAGVDTLRLTSVARTFSFGGVRIDSLRVIAAAVNSLSILVTDGD